MAWPGSRCRTGCISSGAPAAMRICSLHEIEPGDHFGHRMLDLQARVHLDEIELAVLVQELDRADAAIAELPPWRAATRAADLRRAAPR